MPCELSRTNLTLSKRCISHTNEPNSLLPRSVAADSSIVSISISECYLEVQSSPMSASGGGLPQRAPRQSRRRRFQPASTQQQSVDEADHQPSECPDEPMPRCKHTTNSSNSNSNSGVSPHANTGDDTGSASRDALNTEPAYRSDIHTDGAPRSGKGEYNFECAPHAASSERQPTALEGSQI